MASLHTRRTASALLRGADAAVLDDVVVDRRGVLVLDHVSVRLRAGAITLCTGPNGSGKTTLLRVLGQLLRPTSGTVTSSFRGCAELVGVDASLHPDLTLQENLDVVAEIVGAGPGATTAALAHVGLAGAAGRRAGRCSAGMRRRTEFARLQLTRPEILLLDEPDTALDQASQVLVEDAITATVRRGGAVVVATHAPERLEQVATDRWTVQEGRVRTCDAT